MAETSLLGRRHTILSREQARAIASRKRCKGFLIYSDNILESLAVLDLLYWSKHPIRSLGVCYETLDQPIYFFEDEQQQFSLMVKVCGNYTNWDLPPSVSSAISYVDKMDFLVVDPYGNGVVAGETTGTANVGNSQWQREGRKVGAAIQEIPFIYQTYYTGTDRSQQGGPVVREPTSLQVLNHLAYCIRYRVPSFSIYYENPELDRLIGKDRSNTGGKELMASYLGTCLLYSVDPKRYVKMKKTIEQAIIQHMLDYITESVTKRGKQVSRLANDFPGLPNKASFYERREEFVEFVVERINYSKKEDSTFDFLAWDKTNFQRWGEAYRGLPLIRDLGRVTSIVSYLARSKVGIVLDTKKLVEILLQRYSAKPEHIQHIDGDMPTLIIPARMFKGAGKVLAGDPESGEITAFSELFSKTLWGQKCMNVIAYTHVEPPHGFDVHDKLQSADMPTGTKLFRAIKHYADLLILEGKVITWT